jgi:hypothetical protein
MRDMIDTAVKTFLSREFRISPDQVPEMLGTGERFQASLLSGTFDDSRVGQAFAGWFEARPQREGQRETFVRVAIAMGCAPPIVADRVLSCIGEAMSGDRTEFGSLLANELDRLLVQDPPKSPQEALAHQKGAEVFAELKDWLRLQDNGPAEK